ncbi:MAG: methyltransferase family protein [Candidatus Kapaibacterium sp.]
MEKLQIKSYLLVTVQFLCAVFFFYFIGATPLTLFPVILITAGIAIALWAMLTMRFGNITVNPIPKDEAKLVMKGPYAFIRHPMYAAVLIAMLGIAINIETWLAYGVWIILFVDLLVKMRFEERLLREKFSEYPEYIKRTKKVLPWIW